MLHSKACLKRPLKNDKTKVFMTNDSLMKVKSFAECSPWNQRNKQKQYLSVKMKL